MATRLFLRSDAGAGGYADTEKSTVLPVGTSNQSGASLLALSVTAGAGAANQTFNSLAQTAHQDGYFRKWISEPLVVSSITAQTWTIGVSVNEGNAQANAFTVCSIYVIQSDDTVRGFVYDSDTPLDSTEWVNGTLTGRVYTVSGAAVSGVVSTDRLVFELWYHATQGMGVAYGNRASWNGTTDIVDGTANADPASYIETPQDDLFAAGGQSVAVTAASESEAAQAVAVQSVISVTVSGVSETEAAQAVAATSTITIMVGAAAETETAQPIPAIAGAVSISVGAATETEIAQTVAPVAGGGAQSITVTAATETESAQPVALQSVITISVSSAIETEAAQAIPVQASITVTVGSVTETETSQAVIATPGPVTVTVGAVSETETAQTVTPVLGSGPQTVTVTAAVEAESAQPVAITPGAVTVTVGATAETETVGPVTPAATITITVAAAGETETSQTVTAIPGAVSVAVGAATETETAQPVAVVAGGVTFWTPDPVAYVSAGVAYTPLDPDSPPPW